MIIVPFVSDTASCSASRSSLNWFQGGIFRQWFLRQRRASL